MPRTARASVGGVCYHVLNRGNAGMRVFRKAGDYEAFVGLLGQACERVPVEVFGFCLMPTHFHLVVEPPGDGDLGRWMQWLMTSHLRRAHRHYGTSGHLWQGRFRAFPIQADEHFLTVVRYVERNPLRAGLVGRAEAWRWSSLGLAEAGAAPTFLARWPVARPAGWVGWVNEAQAAQEVAALRVSIQRGRPFGSARWVRQTAVRLGLEAAIRPRGRPPGHSKK